MKIKRPIRIRCPKCGKRGLLMRDSTPKVKAPYVTHVTRTEYADFTTHCELEAPEGLEFTEHTKHALHIVSGILCQDLPEEVVVNRRAVAESTLDAGHMTLNGFPEADAEVTLLVDKYDYEAVLSEAEKHVVWGL